MSLAVLKRYKKYSEQFEKEGRRLSQWLTVLPVGQHPPSFERAMTKQSTQPRRKLTPLWKQMRSKIMPSKKTLWQHFPHVPEDPDFPPLFREIAPFLTKKRKRKQKQVRLF